MATLVFQNFTAENPSLQAGVVSMHNQSACRLRTGLIFLSLNFVFGEIVATAEEAKADRSLAVSAGDEQIISSLPAVLSGLNKNYTLETAKSKTITAVFGYSVQAPHLHAKEWVIFTPKPPNLPGQSIQEAKMSPGSIEINDLSPLPRILLRTRLPATDETLRRGFHIQLQIEADLYFRRLIRTTASQTRNRKLLLNEDERKLALRPAGNLDYTKESVKKWIDDHKLLRGKREGEVDFAARVFHAITGSYQYEYLPDQDHSAANICSVNATDCGGMAVLFASVLRSQGVPARILVGRWAKSAKPGERLGSIDYFQDDFVFDTLNFGRKSARLLQNPAYWVTGSGNLDQTDFSKEWTVR